MNKKTTLIITIIVILLVLGICYLILKRPAKNETPAKGEIEELKANKEIPASPSKKMYINVEEGLNETELLR